jgi:N-acylglucosamine-6-phosphate 2-epimerase
MKEVEDLVAAKADVIAVDATKRPRPGFDKPELFISTIKERFKVSVMADISTCKEGITAYKAGADLISTTLSSYTPYTAKRKNS